LIAGASGYRPNVRTGDGERIPTVSEVVRDAAVLCDPDAHETAVTALVEGFVDDDRPATASEDLLGELLETVRAIDGDDGAAIATAAVAAWLATNPGQAHAGDHALREAVRLAFGDEPPEPLVDWLEDRDISA
jgi:hypothetical protein